MNHQHLTVLLATGFIACGAGAAVRQPNIVVLSNRADLVSGGDALVELRLPAGYDTAAVTVELNGASVREAFAVRSDGRFLGLVEGLRDGSNELRVTVAQDQAALTITNHPLGGPIFSGPQVTPWECNTTADPSLGPPTDAQCSAPTRFRYVYRTIAGEFAPLDPTEAYPDDMATTTTAEGVTVPYVVRVERGTMNRGIHEIAVLFEPGEPWTLWDPQAQWNRKLVILFGYGTGQQYRQGLPLPPMLDHEALSRGYVVVSSSMLSNGQHSNFVTVAETAMMLKEHVIETYGPVRFTIGRGASGGALLQHLIADSYPGILDGLLPIMDWEDSMSGAYREFADAGLLLRVFESSHLEYTNAARGAIGGWGADNTHIYTIESRRLPDYNRPDDGTNCAGAASYDPANDPTGVRCTFQDFMVGILGRQSPGGSAPSVYDNTGVQYGLKALEAGEITPEQFVDLNVRLGGYDIDGRWQPQRSEIDSTTAALLHRTGQVTYGRELARVTEIVVRGTNNNDYHYPFRTYVHRQRLIAANGHADSHVYWIAPPDTLSALDAMDRWLTSVEADTSDGPVEMRIVRDKPEDLEPSCWIDGVRVTDLSRCDEVYPYFAEPRTAAGDHPTIYTMKCALKPPRRDDYPVTFTDEQWNSLMDVFPTGVCDYSEPPVGFQPNVIWLSYTGGPGGRPLGAEPVSRLLK